MARGINCLILAILLSPASPHAQEDPQSALARAIYEGDAARVQELIRAGVDVNRGTSHDRTTPLNNAVNYDRAEIVRLLAQAGADVNEEDRRGRSLLIQAILNQRRGALNALLEAGADPNWLDEDDKDALDFLFSRDVLDRELIQRLISHGADINRLRSSGTVLQQACAKKDLPLVRTLLSEGADPNIADPLGMTPLFAAVSAGVEEIVRLLIAAGADPNAQAAGLTPLGLAEIRNNEGMIALLESSGASREPSPPAAGGDPQRARSFRDFEAAAGRQRSRADNPAQPQDAPPGLYRFAIPGSLARASGGLRISGRPDISEDARCEERGEIGAAGTEQTIGHRLFTEDGDNVGVSGETVYVPAGRYRLVTTHIINPWQYVCAAALRTTSGDVTSIWTLKRLQGTSTDVEQWVSIGASSCEARPQGPASGARQLTPGQPTCRPDRETPSIEILTPDPDAEFTFDPSEEGKFLILASAAVEPPELAGQVVWTLEGIGDAEIEVIPEKGEQVEIWVRGLPADNDDFGEKTLTARIPGAQDQTKLKVFFWPTATNHPGEGAGETPNWFYYWSQTSAASGRKSVLRYMASLPEQNEVGTNVLGRHDRTDDFIYLSDPVQSSDNCTRRAEVVSASGTGGGKNATGIDCFGEVILHEARHRLEWHRWWLDGTNQVTRFVHQLAEDSDADYVPRWVESNEPGCSDNDQTSCSNRPVFTSEPREVPDTELYAYYEGWKWVLTAADSEDWSHCGKQWTLTECSN